MRKVLITLIACIALFAIAGAIWWHEMNIVPDITLPNPPPVPSPNAYDYFRAALKLDRNSGKWNIAAANLPPGKIDPSDPDWRHYTFAEKQALVRENQPMIAKIRDGFPYPFAQTGHFIGGFPDISLVMQLREDARMLGFAGRVAGQEGDWEDSIRYDLDAVQLGAKITQNSNLFNRLMAIACEYIGREHAWDAIDHLSAKDACGAALRLEQIQDSQNPLADTLEVDKWNMAGMFRGFFRTPGWKGSVPGLASIMLSGVPNARLGLRQEIILLGTSKKKWLAGYMRYMDQSIDRSRMPYPVAIALPEVPKGADALSRETELDYTRTFFKDTENETENDLLMVSLALRAYKLDHGAYPATLSQLAPSYLKRVPTDPFAAGAPLHYRRRGVGYLLYSVGPDGKDDGGKPIYATKWPDGSPLTGKFRYMVNEGSKGDIVAGLNVKG